MTALRLNEVLKKFRGRLERDECAAATDAALLERFRTHADEAAFAELVRRHGGMVLGVCQRLLRCTHDAEDAFQATFLVLVRRGAAVRKLGSVASWLYGVARRTALEARRAAARRKLKEAGAMRGAAVAADSSDEVREVLDEEIERLPEKYRAPLVLCDLEGKTRKEAARHLGWPEGTVASRLAHARKTLGGRLARRGLAVPGAVITVAAGEAAATAAVPPALVGSTVRAAVGRAVIPPAVAALVKGVLTNMLLKKLKSSLALVVAAVVLGTGGTVFHGGFGTEARAAEESKGRSPADALRHENELLKTNLNVLLEKVHAQEAELQALKSREGGRAQTFLWDTTATAPKVSADRLKLELRAKESAPQVKHDVELFTVTPSTVTLQENTLAAQVATGVQGAAKEAIHVQGNAILILSDPVQQVEGVLKRLRESTDEKARSQAIEELESLTAVLKAQHGKKPEPQKKR